MRISPSVLRWQLGPRSGSRCLTNELKRAHNFDRLQGFRINDESGLPTIRPIGKNNKHLRDQVNIAVTSTFDAFAKLAQKLNV